MRSMNTGVEPSAFAATLLFWQPPVEAQAARLRPMLWAPAKPVSARPAQIASAIAASSVVACAVRGR